MAVVKVIELVAPSSQGFEDAVRQGLAEASKTLRGITGVDITHHTLTIENNQISEYRVTLKVAFLVEHGGG